MPDLPGVTKSKAEAYWMAPYVLVSEERIGKRGATMVTWFNEDGMIKRQTEVSILEPGYVVIISRRFPEAVELLSEAGSPLILIGDRLIAMSSEE